MINLSTSPVLGSMVITANGVWKSDFRLPNGMEFPSDTTSEIVVTDRTGSELARFDGELNADSTRVEYVVVPADHSEIPAGSNFELFVTYDDTPYKVRYGRVVRREASFPGAPVSSTVFDAAVYTDDLQRTFIGPYWVQKKNKTIIWDNSGSSKPYGMGNAYLLWDQSATHWYAPLRTDTMKVNFSLIKFGGGEFVIVLCSNYAMTNWMGVKFDCIANTVRPVTSGATPTDYVNQASTVANTVSSSASDNYTAFYNNATNVLALYKGTSTSPMLTWTDSTNLVQHGEGHRYIGAIFKGNFLTAGPELTYWSAKDDL